MIVYQCNACDEQAPALKQNDDPRLPRRILPEGWFGVDLEVHICKACVEYMIKEKPRKALSNRND